ncbi:MAG: hypothetical protein EPN17_13785 [Methylobacter sp.]|nr:MAG: hypothetical protein EPN17_13785 [Methylobacter sp.]
MKDNHPVPLLFNHLGMPSVQPTDEFSITYKNGMLEAQVKRQSGKVETITQTIRGAGFNQMTNFDPTSMEEGERNILIKRLYNNGRGETQASLGKKFGLSQPQIGRIINSNN